MHAKFERFKKLLDERNVTAYKVYLETGIPQSTLSDWKHGKSNPKLDKVKLLSDYFNVPIEYFLGE